MDGIENAPEAFLGLLRGDNIGKMLVRASERRRAIDWDVSVDSTISRAHQHAAGAAQRAICRSNRLVGDDEPAISAGALAGRADHQAAPGLRAGVRLAGC